ncbi:putative nucleotidyltransferase substrate binding domain-containing protein [Pararhodospirillum oryzae]|uniref:Histidine kinase n=1 Tax=Pararhodospirillum oryzae TaxID=478448 RepID=A0A512H8M7_9PROT|nr:putative nucleotidyltransferase substrate binding domain-containing protein [Pararhodospirillum oryzae]GEO81802.1 histidine kinase [Pararhodospirillum oryzae]
MDVELIEIRDFLAGVHPFDLLAVEVLGEIAQALEIRYARRGTPLLVPGDRARFLYIVRTGAVETRDPQGELLARLGEGECFGVRALMHDGLALNHSHAIEDSLLYLLPAERFARLRQAHRQIDYYFAPQIGGRLPATSPAGQADPALGLMTVRVETMLGRAPVTLGPEAGVRDAARLMRDERVSCILVTEDNRLVGIFTDRDLRNRVVADGLGMATPLSRVMSKHPVGIDASASAFDALLMMSRHNIRHLPVMRGATLAGCLTTTNLIKTQATSAVYLVGDLHKQETAEGMRAVLSALPDLVRSLVDSGASAHNVGHIVSTLTDAATTRLVRLAEKALGPAPVPYVWAAAGSQARHEQTALSDQDNCLILDDAYDEAAHGAYFTAFTRRVCDGLALCGYAHCPGGTMAMAAPWRLPLARWRQLFQGWIDEPEPKALMLASIFFDLRPVAGPAALFGALQTPVLEQARGSRVFQALMAGNALTHQPPLGFFRNLVLVRGGSNANRLDLKHTGVVPIIDLARVHALAAGVRAVNTQDRLKACAEAGSLSAEGAANLREALAFLGFIRLRHQVRQIQDGQPVDNYVAPDSLSSFERAHLKDAFSVVKTMQSALAHTYQLGRF